MIFALFCLQSISIAFGTGTVTKVHDIETVIGGYLSNTVHEHALHATSSYYMRMVQDESRLTSRYFQSVRYIEYGFSMHINSSSQKNSTNEKSYKKLNFIQSIAHFYCGMNISSVLSTSLDNIWINNSQLYMNSVIFPVQIVESYEIIRSEICHRIKLGLYQSVVNMFYFLQSEKPYDLSRFSLSYFIHKVANFISIKTNSFLSLQKVGDMHSFLAKFGEFELYKETVIHHISKWNIDYFNLVAKHMTELTEMKDSERQTIVDACANQIRYPKWHRYVIDMLKLPGNDSLMLNSSKSSQYKHCVLTYILLKGSNHDAANHLVENSTVQIGDLFQLLNGCTTIQFFTLFWDDCSLIVFAIYESYQGDLDGHEYVINEIKLILSHHDVYYTKLSVLTNQTNSKSTLINRLKIDVESKPDVFYPYLNELMNDDQFVHIIKNSTDIKTETYLQKIIYKWVLVAHKKYMDIEMIQKIVAVFQPKTYFEAGWLSVCITI